MTAHHLRRNAGSHLTPGSCGSLVLPHSLNGSCMHRVGCNAQGLEQLGSV